MKTRTLSAQTVSKIGEEAKLQGWVNSRRDHGGVIFIDLRDHTGIVQLAVHPEQKEAFAVANKVRDEFVVSVEGKIIDRSKETINPNLSTGSVEIYTSKFLILNSSKPLPFPVAHGHGEEQNIGEEIRLKYRFLDLRREKMQNMLIKRHKMIKFIRDWMDEKGFIEITTPILTSSSPEGARDFLVPSRLHPGKFYALPQSPQQYKQLLMVGGVQKYFQIAPALRDEDPRADRSPGEHYQCDLEMAFINDPEQVFEIMEPFFTSLAEDFAKKKIWKKPFPRISYQDAMEKYGSDKPDLRFEMAMTDLTEDLKSTGFSVFGNAIKNDGCVKAICCKDGSNLTRSQIDELTDFVKKEGAGGLAYIVLDEKEMRSPILKFLSPQEISAIVSKTEAKPGDIIFFGADDRKIVNKVLGKLRSKLGDMFKLKDPNLIAWAWIYNFPMYEYNEQEKKIDFGHNPFSMPKGGLEALNTQDPLNIVAQQYDIVANGLEICSGAIRNYHPETMYKAFEIVGYSKETVDEKFGGMIRAFEYGAPPHGGMAPGVDRMMMLLEDEPNIREIIAFPKNGSAEDVMMNAPSTVEEKQLKELHIKLDLPKKVTSGK